jgi:hypothetical protein
VSAFPYSVTIDHYGDHETIPCGTFTAAIVVAKLAGRDHPGRVHVLGDGAEGGYGDDGQGFHDGLTEDERERLREAGVLP